MTSIEQMEEADGLRCAARESYGLASRLLLELARDIESEARLRLAFPTVPDNPSPV